jgi:hypothetical protein
LPLPHSIRLTLSRLRDYAPRPVSQRANASHASRSAMTGFITKGLIVAARRISSSALYFN